MLHLMLRKIKTPKPLSLTFKNMNMNLFLRKHLRQRLPLYKTVLPADVCSNSEHKENTQGRYLDNKLDKEMHSVEKTGKLFNS